MMKKLLTLLSCMAFVVCTYAQTPKVEAPAAAKAAFAAKYPKAEKVKWSVEKPGEYEVEFTLNKVSSSALYDATGKQLETEGEIKESELPQAVKAAIAKDFAGYKIDEIEKSTDAKGIASYEMEAAKGKVKLELSFAGDGKLLSKEPLKKEEKEEKEAKEKK
jgi:hypothetical protein